MTTVRRTLLAAGLTAAIGAGPASATGGWTWDVQEGEGPPALTYGPPGSAAALGVTCANASGTVTLNMEADPAKAGDLPDGGKVGMILKGPTGTAETSGRYDAQEFSYDATLPSPTAFADLIRRKGWLDVAVGTETFSVEVDDRAMTSRDRFEALCRAAPAARP